MSKSTIRILSSVFITFIFLYLMTPLGATFNGVVVPDMHLLTFVLIAIAVVIWLIIRRRAGWVWHRTAFDLVFVLWAIAFAVSVLANMESVRRSMIGLWYMLAYIGVWYALHDILSNRGVKRDMLVDALLYSGSMVVLFSFIQLTNQASFQAPVSLIGNPNALGAILLCMTPFAVQRALTASNRIPRIGWGLYSLIIIANLLLTLSRGAWLGIFGSITLLILLLLKHHDMLAVAALRLWWGKRSIIQRRLIGTIAISLIAGLIIAGLLLLNSFSIQARRPELRTRLWNSALQQFAEKPITGQGFYTFGRDYGLSISIPPEQSHAHAHSMPLNIMAEMGLIGLSVFVLSLGIVMRLIIHRWKQFEGQDKLTWIAAISALTGFGIHHLFDLPAMMPIVALVGMLVLILVCAPANPQPLTANWRKLTQSTSVAILWIGLLVSGVWSSNVYLQYLNAMRIAFPQNAERSETQKILDYHKTAQLLNSVTSQDPMMPIYHQQQAFLWGLIAETGDAEAIQHGITAYQRFLHLEPNHAISWANISALQWQAGNNKSAIASIQRATELAPNYGLFEENLHLYQGISNRETMKVPQYYFNQNYARFEFLREPLQTTFLPQVGWGNSDNN